MKGLDEGYTSVWIEKDSPIYKLCWTDGKGTELPFSWTISSKPMKKEPKSSPICELSVEQMKKELNFPINEKFF